MGTRRRAIVMVAVLALAMSSSATAMAQGPKHTSCQAFGYLFAEFAQNSGAFGVSNAGDGISFNCPQ